MINWDPWLRSEHPTKSAELDEFIYHEPLAGEGTMRVCCFGLRTGYLYEFSEVFQCGLRVTKPCLLSLRSEFRG